MGTSSRRVFMFTGLGAVLGVRATARYREPQVYVIAIGVSDYNYSFAPLDYAGSDAIKVAAAFKSLESSDRYQVSSLATLSVRLKSVLDALDDFAARTKPGDTLVFYFAGYGSRRNGKDYLLLSDTKPDAYTTTALSIDMLGEKLATCKATQRLLILDASRDSSREDRLVGFNDGKVEGCFGDRLEAVARKTPSAQEVRSAVIYACKPGQSAKESDVDRGGVFTSRLVSALLSSKADTLLTVQALYNRVADSMPVELKGVQDPDIAGDGTIAIPVTNPIVSSRITDYRELKAYVESLRPIPAGTFLMGSASGLSDEKPIHSVTVSAFRLCSTPVTFGVWKEYCAATGTKLPEAPSWGILDDHPVVNVSWNDIMGVDGKGGFCAWASDIAGFRLTLPTESQFEYAARGGKSGLEYPWGTVFDDSKVWSSMATRRSSTAPVKSSKNRRSGSSFETFQGLSDMSGNVWQWCSDLYAPYTNVSEPNPVGPSLTSNNLRCVRGASWNSLIPDLFRCANRLSCNPEYWSNYLGFRLSAGPG